MKEREWLALRGLAKPGARGRLSLEAKQALAQARAEGIDIESLPTPTEPIEYKPVIKVKTEPKEKKVSQVRVAAVQFDDTKRREETVAWAIDKGERSDLLIALSSCYGCNKTISRCIHDTPLKPAWLGGGEALLIKPN